MYERSLELRLRITNSNQYIGKVLHKEIVPANIGKLKLHSLLSSCLLLQDVVNTYCWIHSTYTIPSAFWKRIGIDVAHPGIDKTIDPDERRYVKYYQWVCFCLFFQVRTFISYLPHSVAKFL